jgi:hypothetical protein
MPPKFRPVKAVVTIEGVADNGPDQPLVPLPPVQVTVPAHLWEAWAAGAWRETFAKAAEQVEGPRPAPPATGEPGSTVESAAADQDAGKTDATPADLQTAFTTATSEDKS